MAQEQELNELVRIANNDLPGRKAIYYALTRIKGISFSLANAICNLSGIEKNKKVGYCTREDLDKIEKVIADRKSLPDWMLNRRRDYDTGENLHLLGGDVKFSRENDIRRLQKVKSRRGLRHAWDLPVRGQRTRSNFRKGTALGVKRKADAKAGRM